MFFVIQNVAQASKHIHVTQVRCFTFENFIGSSLGLWLDIDLIYHIARSVDCFRPEPRWNTVSTHHCSSHFLQCSILSFHNPILLRSSWSDILMTNTLTVTELVKLLILKLTAMIALDLNDSSFIMFELKSKDSETLKGIRLVA
ncbi:hypothetical protein YC2023_016222 [Brassica napus]